MIENFATIGYDSNNMHLAAYDWRLSFYNLEVRDKYFSKLKATIELAKKIDGKKSVIIGHSMGATVVLYFLKWVESSQGGNGGPDWVNNHIHTFVNIGGPLLGVPKALSALLSGEMRDTVELGSFGVYVLERFFSKRERCDLFRTWGGLSSMLPKGGDAVWGNLTHAPDDREDANVSYGPMLTFLNQLESIAHGDNNGLHNHTSFSGVKFLQKHTGSPYGDMLDSNYSFGIANPEMADKDDHTKWANPLESQLPKAPDMKIYCFYGWGKETERRYYYSQENFEQAFADSECAECNGTIPVRSGGDTGRPAASSADEALSSLQRILVQIDAKINSDQEWVRSGVHNGEGDGTVPLMSLGYMCVKGWQNKTYNPSKIRVITREFEHEIGSTMDLRGGSKTADHVDIMGNYALTEDVLKIASGFHDEEINDRVHSKIREYADRVKL